MAEHQHAQQPKKTDNTSQKQTIPPKQFPTSHPAAIIQRARINLKSLTHADVMQLQRTIGNRAVGKLLTEIGLISSKPKQAPPVQMQPMPEEEEEPLQGKMAETIQRQEIPEEEEPLQGKMIEPIQRQEIPEEKEPLQGKFESIQRQEIPEEEEPLQGKFENKSKQNTCPSCSTLPIQRAEENHTGMPDNLKAGVENLSGIDMSDVRVHYNSSKPAEVGALAYTQGTDIHVAPGQECHIPHESWHVVQQAEGRVRPTIQLKDMAINDDVGLEHEADVMASIVQKTEQKAHNEAEDGVYQLYNNLDHKGNIIQRVPYKNIVSSFNEVFRLDQFLVEASKTINDYQDGILDKTQAQKQLKEIWSKMNFEGEYTNIKDLKTKKEQKFEELKTVTDYPEEGSSNTFKISIGEKFENLMHILKIVDGTSFKEFVDKQLFYLLNIRKRLESNPDVTRSFWKEDMKQTHITFSPVTADAHGFGAPTKIELSAGESKKALMYKDRPGEVDKLVTDLFKEINKILKEALLPEYEQQVFPDKHLLSEFITGVPVDKKVEYFSGVAFSLHKIVDDSEILPKVEAKLQYLNAVAKRIGLTDLHEENLVYDTSKKQVVPVDLEAFSVSASLPTGLYGDKDPDFSLLFKANADILALIEEFKQTLRKTERRYVPVPTGVLANNLTNKDKLFKLIKENFEKNKITSDDVKLDEYLSRACEEKIVPLFTILDDSVYCSPTEKVGKNIVGTISRK